MTMEILFDCIIVFLFGDLLKWQRIKKLLKIFVKKLAKLYIIRVGLLM